MRSFQLCWLQGVLCRGVRCHQEGLRRVYWGGREGERHQNHTAGGGRHQTGSQRPSGSSSAYQHQRPGETQPQHGLTAKPHPHCQTGTSRTNNEMCSSTPFWSVWFQHAVFPWLLHNSSLHLQEVASNVTKFGMLMTWFLREIKRISSLKEGSWSKMDPFCFLHVFFVHMSFHELQTHPVSTKTL